MGPLFGFEVLSALQVFQFLHYLDIRTPEPILRPKIFVPKSQCTIFTVYFAPLSLQVQLSFVQVVSYVELATLGPESELGVIHAHSSREVGLN
jgi:hypothetical protein